MKLSNTEAALKKIKERDLLVERRNAIRDNKWSVVLTDEHMGSYSHDITEAVDYSAIVQSALFMYNKRIAENAMELKELGVYVDTDETVMPSMRYTRI